MYQYTNKHNRSVAKNSSVKHTPSPKTIPNSAMLAVISTGGTSDFDLDGAMMQKMNALMNQIPAAEQEADRLSRGVHSTSFEGIREEMGQRLGADLSEIRLHTDAAAAEQADQIGAAAYTTGKDIYWGSGGFKPETMAHELVHTVQQGAVAGETSAAVPMGTVQMEPTLSLGSIEPSYEEEDTAYLNLRGLMDKYNGEEDPIEKRRIEMELMRQAANYVSMYGTMDTPIHKRCTEDAESLICQLSAPPEMRFQAIDNLIAIYNSINDLSKKEGQTEENHTSTQNKMRSTVADTVNGIWHGEIMNRSLSPTLHAILTETMAGQSANTMLGNITLSGQYTGATNVAGVTDARPPTISLDFHDFPLEKLVPGFFHEATHGHADQVYGSIVTMPRECIPIEELVLREEKERADTATNLGELIPSAVPSDRKVSDNLLASLSKIGYATKAGLESNEENHYFERALAGYKRDRQNPVPLINLKTARDKLSEYAVLAQLGKTGDQSEYTHAIEKARTEDERTAAQTKYDTARKKALSDYNRRFPTMIEYDPSINEALMHFELSPDGNRDSPFYRALKAAALQSHVKRHNANLMNQIIMMQRSTKSGPHPKPAG